MERLREKLLTGDTAQDSSLVRNILRKKELLAHGDKAHQSIRTALVMGGGTMRSAYGAGVLWGLEEAGLSDTFDVVVGVSAGAASLAYFLAEQTAIGAPFWYDDLVNRKFLNVARLTRVLDLDYADELMRNIKPLDTDAIRASRSEFYIGLTNAKTGEGEIIDAKEDGVDIVTAVIASSALPVVYNKTHIINGVEYYDGGISNGIPVSFAIEQGCTDILIVLNSPIEAKDEDVSRLEKFLVSFYMRKFTPEARKAMTTKNRQHNKSLEAIIDNPDSVRVGIIAPEKATVSRTSKNRKELYQFAMQGKAQALSLFGEK